jgi:hypothetical protein
MTVMNGKWSINVDPGLANGKCLVVAEITDEEGRKTVDRQTLVIDVPEVLNHKVFMVGYPDGTFKPTRSVTRAEMAAALVRLIEQQSKRPATATKTFNYTDVKTTNWYYSVVQTISRYGLMSGYPNGSFKPNEAVTTKEIKAIVVKYISLMNKQHGSYKAVVCPRCKTNFHFDELKKFLNDQKMTGAPQAFTNTVLTRAEIVTVMNRLFARGPLTQKQMPNWTDVPSTNWAYAEIQEASHNHVTNRLDNDRE